MTTEKSYLKKIILLLMFLLFINSYSKDLKYKPLEKVTLDLETYNKQNPSTNFNIKAPSSKIELSKDEYSFDYYSEYGVEGPSFEGLSLGEKASIIFSSFLKDPKSHKNIIEKDNSKLEIKLDANK